MQNTNPIDATTSPTALPDKKYNWKKGTLVWNSAVEGTYRRKDPKPLSKKDRKKLKNSVK